MKTVATIVKTISAVSIELFTACNTISQNPLPNGQCNPHVDNSYVLENFLDNQLTIKRLPNGGIELENIFLTNAPYETSTNSNQGDYQLEGVRVDGTALFIKGFNFNANGRTIIHSPAIEKISHIRIYDRQCNKLLEVELPQRL